MGERFENTNVVNVVGVIISKSEYSHEINGEGFYSFELEIERLSGTSDFIQVMVSDRLVNIRALEVGSVLHIEGQFRSYNKQVNNKRKLILYIFARNIEFVEESSVVNQIVLNGYVCKEPVYRKTPLGREITDLILAVNRQYGKSDYIPCIAWGRNALFASELKVGDKLEIHGRVQSREYLKEYEPHVAYEVSVSSIQKEN